MGMRTTSQVTTVNASLLPPASTSPKIAMSSLGGDDSNGHPKDEPEKGPGTGPSDDPGDENDPGYKIFSGTPPTQDKIEAAMAEISTESLRMFRQSESDLGFQMLGWGKNFDDLLHDGLDVSASFFARDLKLTK